MKQTKIDWAGWRKVEQDLSAASADLSAKVEAAMCQAILCQWPALGNDAWLSLAEGSKLLAQLSAVSEIPISDLEQRFGKHPVTTGADVTKIRWVAIESDLYNDVIRAMIRYYSYHGQFPGDASPS